MGPSTSVDGEVSDAMVLVSSPPCFNGAVDKRRRRVVVGGNQRLLPAASMGPSTSVDGEFLGRLLGLHPVVASMGPSTSVDGELGHVDVIEILGRASMGPSTSVDGERAEIKVIHHRRSRFNGAVDKRRRRVLGPGPPAPR